MRMPGMTGIEAAGLMKRQDPALEIIMLTAYVDPTLMAQATEVGITEYLIKGEPVELLLEAIDRAWLRRQTAVAKARGPAPQ